MNQPDTDPALPNFLIIGAGKSGTTSLWSYLNQHPEIGMSAIKEPSFFSMDDVHARGIGWYKKLFDGHQDKIARGEASNSYSATQTYPKTIDRIFDTLGKPKLIYIVRHPRDRTESDWMQRSKIQQVSLADFIRTDPVYADKNNYLRTYARYTAAFGTENLLLLFYDDLRKDPSQTLKKTARFLGVDENFEFNVGTRHGQSTDVRDFMFGLSAIRKYKIYADFSLLVPEAIKNGLRNVLSRRRTIDRPVWSEADDIWFQENFEGVTKDFLQNVGKPVDYWEFPKASKSD